MGKHLAAQTVVYTFVYLPVMINTRVRGFDWDTGNRAKCQKHGVPIAEIEAPFMGNPRIASDPRHSHDEDRMIAVGRTSVGRPVFVAFTLRGKC